MPESTNVAFFAGLIDRNRTLSGVRAVASIFALVMLLDNNLSDKEIVAIQRMLKEAKRGTPAPVDA